MLTPYNGDSLDFMVTCKSAWSKVRMLDRFDDLSIYEELQRSTSAVLWIQIAALTDLQLKRLEGLWNADRNR